MSIIHSVSLLHATAHNSICPLGHHLSTVLPIAGRLHIAEMLFFAGKVFYSYRILTFFITVLLKSESLCKVNLTDKHMGELMNSGRTKGILGSAVEC